MLRGLSLFLCIISALQCARCQTRYQATIDMAGYKGFANFDPTGNIMAVNITMTSGPNIPSLDTFEIANFPAVFGGMRNTFEVCQNLGAILTTFSSPTTLSAGTSSQFNLTSVSENTLFNRGFIMRSNDNQVQVCATILQTGSSSVQTYEAKFIGPIVGNVWIRVRESSPGLFIFSDLAYSNPTANPASTTTFTLNTYNGQIGSQQFSSRCSGLSARALIGTLTVGNSVSAAGKQNVIFTETQNTSSLRRYLGLVNGSGSLIACAELDSISSKTVTSRLFWDNIKGSITMTQLSPFDSTTTSVSLSGITSTPAQYHVHLYPVPQRLSASEQRCSGDNVAGHFNPYGIVVANSPANATGTSDQYEIGDLSGKYGLLSSQTVNEVYVDWNLPLFGVNSVVGRSIVIHYPNSTRWVCASIEYPGDVTSAIVRFTHPAYGFMLFRQETGKPWSDVTIYGELANLNGTTTLAHNFHVHEYPVGSGCASTGPHYDPAGLAASNGYATSCSSANPFQCELGDLSRRLTPINIASQLPMSNKFFFTDVNMNLAGLFSVIGRSIVVHVANRGAARYACGNITLIHNTVVRNSDNDWKGDNSDGSVTGYLTFTQNTEFDRVRVQSTVTGLNNNARTYHIHILPIQANTTGNAQCANPSVEGHYNPFSIAGTPTPRAFTYDLYEVGDLSGKYGTINNSNAITLTNINDNNLPLTTGIVSSAGRSIVIHRDDSSGSRWKCNTIDLQPGDSTGFAVEAIAVFNTNSIVGFVRMRQIVYEDGSASVTTILVRLQNVDKSVTPNHNWHVHVEPITDQTQCAGALGHFDPYLAAAAPDYSTVCNKYNPLACEVGDLSRKQEQYTIDGNRRLYIDNDLPLHTDQTVLGRSIVFHMQNGGASRLVCANILPLSPVTNAYTIGFRSTATYHEYRFTNAIANLLGIARLRVVVLHNVAVPVNIKSCSYVMIAIAGEIPQSNITELLSGPSSLNPFNSAPGCTSTTGAIYLGNAGGGTSQTEQNLLFISIFAVAVLFAQKLFL